MATIREAKAVDFEKVHPLLLEFHNPHVTEEQWRQLFVDHSGRQEGRFGYVLWEGDEAVGFLGTTISERVLRGQRVRLCNMSNWIVKSEFRGHSMALLAKVLANKNVVITNMSPTPQVLKMCEKIGFSRMDKSERIILPVPSPAALVGRAEVLTDREALARALDEESLRLFRDHQLPWHFHALIRSAEGDCYVMMNRSFKSITGRLRLPFARVHHIGSPEVFVRHADRLLLEVIANVKVVGVIVEERMLEGRTVWHSFRRPGGARTGAFRSNEEGLRPEDIDGLYSELVLLNY